MPRDRRKGASVTLAAVPPPRQRGPVSNSIVRPEVCTTAARPCPTSSTVRSTAPGGGSGPGRHTSAMNTTATSHFAARPGTTIAASDRPTAIAASQAGTAGGRCTPPGRSAAQYKAGQQRSSSAASAFQVPSASAGAHGCSAMPPSVAGNSTNEKNGIASALTSGPASGMPPKATTSTGASTTVTAACARTNCRRYCHLPCPACTSPISAATAANDSQKPAEVTPTGSPADNSSALAARTWPGGACRRAAHSASATATIATVLTVGSEAPASRP